MPAVEYRISKRARHVRITVYPGGTARVTVPQRLSREVAERFVEARVEWIQQAAARMKHLKPLPVSGRRAYLAHKEEARAIITECVHKWNTYYNHPFTRIAIKDTKRAWGSCSHKGNLNFSYALMFLPHDLRDYVVVHELCHLREHNHSPRFWALVAQTMPRYQEHRRALRHYVL